MYLLFYLFFTFIIYSFAGWVIEELYSKHSTGRFKKEGFLKGPLKPMYGIAMTILIFYYEALKIRGIPFIILCFLIPTTVEYISGYIMKHIFNKVYWDYSNLKFNIRGYVSLLFSCYWCALSYVVVVYLNPLISYWYIGYKNLINYILASILLIFISDFIITIMSYNKIIIYKKFNR